MNVRELIKELRKIEDKDLEVGMAMHDNREGEVAAWVSSVSEAYHVEDDEETDLWLVILHA